MKKQWIMYLALISLFVLAVMVPIAGAYDTYSAGCVNCHGSFRAATYSSLAVDKAANPAWPGTSLALHNGHANGPTGSPPGMLNGNCNACHFGASRIPVYTYQSSGTAPFNLGCSGCHDGSGLRAHHVNSGADTTCYDCHSDPAPDPENILRPVYTAASGTTSGTTNVNNACDPAATGFEGRLKDVTSIGLDNDGNLLYDQNDPACVVSAAKISLSPASLAFGSQATGSSSPAQTVTISNTGTAVLNVTGITNSNTTDFSVTALAVPFNVAAGGSQTFSVVFGPGSTGAKTATITVSSSAGNPTVSASGTGTAPSLPVLSVSPATLAFGNQTTGTTSAAKTVTITNTGTGTLNVTGISSSNAEFAFSPTTISSIVAGGSATLNITFTPAAPTGSKSATISILSNGGNATVSATGTGVAAGAISVSPVTLTYASQTVGTTSASQTVTITNTGGTALTVNSITNSNAVDFVLTASATPLTINGGATQTFTVAFKPATAGTKSATIAVSSTAGNATVSATGTGVAAGAISVSPVTLTYASQTVGTTSASQTVTITNTGGTALTVNSITNSNAVDFVLTASATPLTINGGATQTFTVAFKPATAGTKSATIAVSSTAGNATVSATGTGAAAAAAGISVSPSTLAYGNQLVGTASATKTVTITNTGGTALTVNSITNSNAVDFVLTASATPLTINGGATQTFTVAFKPATAGAKSATIAVSSTAGNAIVSASGTGAATAAGISVSPSTLAYGNQTVGTASATKTVTITNTGGTALTVSSIINTNIANFVLTAPATPFTINGGATQTFTVAFKPATAGAKSATIAVSSTAGNAIVSASGTGAATAAGISVSPSTLAYGNQTVGTASATKTVTITNTGGTALTVNSITNSNIANFVLTAPATPFTINGGATQTFTVAFKPATAGAKSATIAVSSTAGNAIVSASGTGAAAAAAGISVSPSILAYGNQTVGTASATKTVTITNTGGTALTVNSITNSNIANFVLTAPATPFTINGGATQTFTVAFKPATAGAKSATIAVSSTAGNAIVRATGTGVSDVALDSLNVPAQISGRVGSKLSVSAKAEATATLNESATVIMRAVHGLGVAVTISPSYMTKTVAAGYPDHTTEFSFKSTITCLREGTWPVTWTSTISAAKNGDHTNDRLTGKTQVICSDSYESD